MGQFVFIGLIGFAVLLIGCFKAKKLRASRDWAQAIGMITESTVTEEYSRGDNDSPDSYTYTPVVRYRFEVEGRTVESDRITFDRRGYQKRQDAVEVAAAFQPGAQVDVFYNPAKPADAVLRRASGSAWILVAAGAGVVILAIAAALR